MTLFDPAKYESDTGRKPRKPTEQATCTPLTTDGSWYAVARASGMVRFAHRLGRSPNNYASITTVCGVTGHVVEHFENNETINACDVCRTKGTK